MWKLANRLRGSLAVACILAMSGCQVWHSPLPISRLMASKGERQVIQQAENDPFPTPSQVGFREDE